MRVPPTLVSTHHWPMSEAVASSWPDDRAHCMQVQWKHLHQHNQPNNQQESTCRMLEFEVTIEVFRFLYVLKSSSER